MQVSNLDSLQVHKTDDDRLVDPNAALTNDPLGSQSIAISDGVLLSGDGASNSSQSAVPGEPIDGPQLNYVLDDGGEPRSTQELLDEFVSQVVPEQLDVETMVSFLTDKLDGLEADELATVQFDRVSVDQLVTYLQPKSHRELDALRLAPPVALDQLANQFSTLQARVAQYQTSVGVSDVAFEPGSIQDVAWTFAQTLATSTVDPNGDFQSFVQAVYGIDEDGQAVAFTLVPLASGEMKVIDPRQDLTGVALSDLPNVSDVAFVPLFGRTLDGVVVYSHHAPKAQDVTFLTKQVSFQDSTLVFDAPTRWRQVVASYQSKSRQVAVLADTFEPESQVATGLGSVRVQSGTQLVREAPREVQKSWQESNKELLSKDFNQDDYDLNVYSAASVTLSDNAGDDMTTESGESSLSSEARALDQKSWQESNKELLSKDFNQDDYDLNVDSAASVTLSDNAGDDMTTESGESSLSWEARALDIGEAAVQLVNQELLSKDFNQDDYLIKGVDGMTTESGDYWSIDAEGLEKLSEWARELIDMIGIYRSIVMAIFRMFESKRNVVEILVGAPPSRDKGDGIKDAAQYGSVIQKVLTAVYTELLENVKAHNDEVYEKEVERIESERSGCANDVDNWVSGGELDKQKENKLAAAAQKVFEVQKQIISELYTLTFSLNPVREMAEDFDEINAEHVAKFEDDFKQAFDSIYQDQDGNEMGLPDGNKTKSSERDFLDINTQALAMMRKRLTDMQSMMRLFFMMSLRRLRNMKIVTEQLYGRSIGSADDQTLTNAVEDTISVQNIGFDNFSLTLFKAKQHYNKAINHRITAEKIRKSQGFKVMANLVMIATMAMCVALGPGALTVGFLVAAGGAILSASLHYGGELYAEMTTDQVADIETIFDSQESLAMFLSLIYSMAESQDDALSRLRDAERGSIDQVEAAVDVQNAVERDILLELGQDKMFIEEKDLKLIDYGQLTMVRERLVNAQNIRRLINAMILDMLSARANVLSIMSGGQISVDTGTYDAIFEAEINLVNNAFRYMINDLQDIQDISFQKFTLKNNIQKIAVKFAFEVGFSLLGAALGAYGGKLAGKFGGKLAGKFGGKLAGKFGGKLASKYGAKLAGTYVGKLASKYGAKLASSVAEALKNEQFRQQMVTWGMKSVGAALGSIVANEALPSSWMHVDSTNDAQHYKLWRKMSEKKKEANLDLLEQRDLEAKLSIMSLYQESEGLQVTGKPLGELESTQRVSVNYKKVNEIVNQLKDIAIFRQLIASVIHIKMVTMQEALSVIAGARFSTNIGRMGERIASVSNGLMFQQLDDVVSYLHQVASIRNRQAAVRAETVRSSISLAVNVAMLGAGAMYVQYASFLMIAAMVVDPMINIAFYGSQTREDFGESGHISGADVEKTDSESFEAREKAAFDSFNDASISSHEGGRKALNAENLTSAMRSLNLFLKHRELIASMRQAMLSQMRKFSSIVAGAPIYEMMSVGTREAGMRAQARRLQLNYAFSNLREKVVRYNDIVSMRQKAIEQSFELVIRAVSAVVRLHNVKASQGAKNPAVGKTPGVTSVIRAVSAVGKTTGVASVIRAVSAVGKTTGVASVIRAVSARVRSHSAKASETRFYRLTMRFLAAWDTIQLVLRQFTDLIAFGIVEASESSKTRSIKKAEKPHEIASDSGLMGFEESLSLSSLDYNIKSDIARLRVEQIQIKNQLWQLLAKLVQDLVMDKQYSKILFSKLFIAAANFVFSFKNPVLATRLALNSLPYRLVKPGLPSEKQIKSINLDDVPLIKQATLMPNITRMIVSAKMAQVSDLKQMRKRHTMLTEELGHKFAQNAHQSLESVMLKYVIPPKRVQRVIGKAHAGKVELINKLDTLGMSSLTGELSEVMNKAVGGDKALSELSGDSSDDISQAEKVLRAVDIQLGVLGKQSGLPDRDRAQISQLISNLQAHFQELAMVASVKSAIDNLPKLPDTPETLEQLSERSAAYSKAMDKMSKYVDFVDQKHLFGRGQEKVSKTQQRVSILAQAVGQAQAAQTLMNLEHMQQTGASATEAANAIVKRLVKGRLFDELNLLNAIAADRSVIDLALGRYDQSISGAVKYEKLFLKNLFAETLTAIGKAETAIGKAEDEYKTSLYDTFAKQIAQSMSSPVAARPIAESLTLLASEWSSDPDKYQEVRELLAALHAILTPEKMVSASSIGVTSVDQVSTLQQDKHAIIAALTAMPNEAGAQAQAEKLLQEEFQLDDASLLACETPEEAANLIMNAYFAPVKLQLTQDNIVKLASALASDPAVDSPQACVEDVINQVSSSSIDALDMVMKLSRELAVSPAVVIHRLTQQPFGKQSRPLTLPSLVAAGLMQVMKKKGDDKKESYTEESYTDLVKAASEKQTSVAEYIVSLTKDPKVRFVLKGNKEEVKAKLSRLGTASEPMLSQQALSAALNRKETPSIELELMRALSQLESNLGAIQSQFQIPESQLIAALVNSEALSIDATGSLPDIKGLNLSDIFCYESNNEESNNEESNNEESNNDESNNINAPKVDTQKMESVAKSLAQYVQAAQSEQIRSLLSQQSKLRSNAKLLACVMASHDQFRELTKPVVDKALSEWAPKEQDPEKQDVIQRAVGFLSGSHSEHQSLPPHHAWRNPPLADFGTVDPSVVRQEVRDQLTVLEHTRFLRMLKSLEALTDQSLARHQQLIQNLPPRLIQSYLLKVSEQEPLDFGLLNQVLNSLSDEKRDVLQVALAQSFREDASRIPAVNRLVDKLGLNPGDSNLVEGLISIPANKQLNSAEMTQLKSLANKVSSPNALLFLLRLMHTQGMQLSQASRSVSPPRKERLTRSALGGKIKWRETDFDKLAASFLALVDEQTAPKLAMALAMDQPDTLAKIGAKQLGVKALGQLMGEAVKSALEDNEMNGMVSITTPQGEEVQTHVFELVRNVAKSIQKTQHAISRSNTLPRLFLSAVMETGISDVTVAHRAAEYVVEPYHEKSGDVITSIEKTVRMHVLLDFLMTLEQPRVVESRRADVLGVTSPKQVSSIAILERLTNKLVEIDEGDAATLLSDMAYKRSQISDPNGWQVLPGSARWDQWVLQRIAGKNDKENLVKRVQEEIKKLPIPAVEASPSPGQGHFNPRFDVYFDDSWHELFD